MLEVEVHEAGRELGADQGGQVHLVALEHVLDVAGLPLSDDPIEKNMVDDDFQEREREIERERGRKVEYSLYVELKQQGSCPINFERVNICR